MVKIIIGLHGEDYYRLAWSRLLKACMVKIIIGLHGQDGYKIAN